MNWRKTTGILPLVASVGVGLAGCGSEGPSAPATLQGPKPLPPSLQAGNVMIVNDPAVLESRLERASRPLSVVSLDSPRSPREQLLESTEATLTLVGTVRAPLVDGRVVQANDVEIDGRTAVIAYNVAGEVFAGAVQVVDFIDPERPKIVSEVLYRAADVDAVALEGSHLYVGLASADATLDSPAMLEELELTSRGVEQSGEWLDLPSWACVDVAVHGEEVLAAVGAAAGAVVHIYRGSRLELLHVAPAFDVRGVATEDGQTALSVCGTEGMLMTHDMRNMAMRSEMRVEGYRNEAAKGTIEAHSHRCYLGAGDGGMQVMDDSGVLARLGCSAFNGLGSDAAVVNAVSVANQLGFVAAGPGGLQVVRLGRYRSDGREAGETEGLRILGRLTFEDGSSCNMVKAKNDILVAAAGAGGVKLVSMSFAN